MARTMPLGVPLARAARIHGVPAIPGLSSWLSATTPSRSVTLGVVRLAVVTRLPILFGRPARSVYSVTTRMSCPPGVRRDPHETWASRRGSYNSAVRAAATRKDSLPVQRELHDSRL